MLLVQGYSRDFDVTKQNTTTCVALPEINCGPLVLAARSENQVGI